MAGSVKARHATLGEVMKLATPGPPFGKPHCGSTVMTTEYWKLTSSLSSRLKAR
jgi:hypothetical protein